MKAEMHGNATKHSETQRNAPDTDTDSDTEVDILQKTIQQLSANICLISNQIELDTVKDWINTVPEEWINEAIKTAALNKARSIKYVDAILMKWAAKYKPEEKPWEATRDGNAGSGKGGGRGGGTEDVPEGWFK